MEIIEYEIQQYDTLASIAEKHNITIEELVDYHNQHCGITQQILGDKIPVNVNLIFLRNKETITEKEKFLEQIGKFRERKARYRTKQINIVKINDVISAHSAVECEYVLTINNHGTLKAEVILDDSVYNFYTNGSELLGDFLRASDTVKDKLQYKLDLRGQILAIENLEYIQQNWHRFKKQLPANKFFKETGSDALTQIINTGNIEYNSEEILLKNSNSNLFNQIMFGQYLTNYYDDFELEEFTTQSHFFPQIHFDVDCVTEKIREDDLHFRFSKKGNPRFVDIDSMIIQYEEMYKPQIGFKFTDYLYDFEIDFTISKEDGLITEATVNLDERIKNNLQSQVIYQLKKVEL